MRVSRVRCATEYLPLHTTTPYFRTTRSIFSVIQTNSLNTLNERTNARPVIEHTNLSALWLDMLAGCPTVYLFKSRRPAHRLKVMPHRRRASQLLLMMPFWNVFRGKMHVLRVKQLCDACRAGSAVEIGSLHSVLEYSAELLFRWPRRAIKERNDTHPKLVSEKNEQLVFLATSCVYLCSSLWFSSADYDSCVLNNSINW